MCCRDGGRLKGGVHNSEKAKSGLQPSGWGLGSASKTSMGGIVLVVAGFVGLITLQFGHNWNFLVSWSLAVVGMG